MDKTPPIVAPGSVTMENAASAFAQLADRVIAGDEAFAVMEAGVRGNPVALGPRIPEASVWIDDMVKGAANNSAKWKRNTLAPSKDPVATALKAATKWENEVRRAIDEGAFASGVSGQDEQARIATIQATPDSAVADGMKKREAKIRRKVDGLRQLQLANVAALDAMPVDTPQDRKNKMLANFDNMVEIGRRIKRGV